MSDELSILAEKMFPNINKSVSHYNNLYPKRKETVITRFWPSPTWFMHIWWVFTAFIAERLAHLNGWKFLLRLEDTDRERYLENSLQLIVSSLKKFWLNPDEWPIWEWFSDVGEYWPYKQSERKDIYHAYAKDLVRKGLAYPCFMSKEDLDNIRLHQQNSKITPWIYLDFSKYRNYSVNQLIHLIDEWKNYVVRLKSPWIINKRVILDDELRWKLEMNDNYLDVILLKSDWLPTYHFAHVIDDFLMWTTHVIRAEEWLPSLPLHVQLFDLMWLVKPKYLHTSQLLKLDDWKKRKLSKRKDLEANIEFFLREWYIKESIMEYLYTIMDSSFESWRDENPEKSYLDYKFSISKLPLSWALVDMKKLDSVSNRIMSQKSTDELINLWKDWSKIYDISLFDLMVKYPKITYEAINIERFTDKDPKRFTKLLDIKSQLAFFYDETFLELIKWWYNIDSNLDEESINKILNYYLNYYNPNLSKEEWFEDMKKFSSSISIAINNKEYKTWNYKWKIWDVAMLLRVILLWSRTTPDLWSSMNVLWLERVKSRILLFIEKKK